MVAEARAMAKKAASKPGPVAKGDPPTRVVASFKAGDKFEAWFHRLGKHMRMPVSTLIEHALICLAKAHDFDEEPPERV